MKQRRTIVIAWLFTALSACGGGSEPSPTTSNPNLPTKYGAPSAYDARLTATGRDSAGNTFALQGDVTLKGMPYPDTTADGMFTLLYEGTASFQVTDTYAGCQPATKAISVNVSILLESISEVSQGLPGNYYLLAVPGEIVAVSVQCGTATVDVPITFSFVTQCDAFALDSPRYFPPFIEEYLDIRSPSGRKTLTCALSDGSFSTTTDLVWTLTGR
jgi:hypothetical protein